MSCNFCFTASNKNKYIRKNFEVMANDKPAEDRTNPKDIIPPKERAPFEGEKIPVKKS